MEERIKFPCPGCLCLATCLSVIHEKWGILPILRERCSILDTYCINVGKKVYLKSDSELRRFFDSAKSLKVMPIQGVRGTDLVKYLKD